MNVLIVGAGSMGIWFGTAIGSDATITYADVDREAAAAAAETTGGSVTTLDGNSGRDGDNGDGNVEDGVGDKHTQDEQDTYDAVCLAVPMAHVTEAIAEQASRADHAVIDVSGVMAPPLAAMREHAPDRERVSLHPLFAPERAPGSIAVVRDVGGPVTDDLLAALAARGNDLVDTTAAEHDDAMETVQAMTHATVLSFALAADSVPDGFETPIYEQLQTLAEQMTGGTPRVYADIQSTFDGAEAIADAARTIADADPAELESLYQEAGARWHDDSETETETETATSSPTTADQPAEGADQ
ncbi:prephenate dehydrogenase/arogenate dehydrogenase family protein [Natrialba sp. SSL1]|uniref:prephenate dehydrogenase/arogenate dehydrogenase family protein n=1 Tax=Natrialba sp. SSL1 TaxID=1869245 RepID=UPI0008F94228|nr:prephenate dehydrogenase/arogenate dehydrogenase family protein [Natrialba sp. SSL1]OIB58642.1 prephenate dehydrogenase [Natrialba sp. SSL1]